jgi:hypothetical protein
MPAGSLGADMSDMNEFQVSCESALVSALGEPISRREVLGSSERYIVGHLPGTELRIFIYSDGAEISGPGVDSRFERPDYASLTALCQAFIRKALDLRNAGVWLG